MLTPEQQDALVRIARASVDSEKATGCPAELSASQCVYESGWLSRAPQNNAFGIKVDHHGSGQQYILTSEFLNGQWKHMPLAFEAYASLSDCFADHARLIQQGVYLPAWLAYLKDKDLNTYITGVAAHYATDPAYSAKMIAEANSTTIRTAVQAARQG